MIKFRRNRRASVDHVFRAAAVSASMLCASSFLTPMAQGQLSWDPGNTGPAVSGGAGAWDTTSSFWWNGSADTTWTDGNSADFAGSSGIVTLSGPRSATGLTFGTTTGYAISGSILTLTSPASVTVGSGVTTTINSNVSGTDGLNVSGGGTLILNNNNTGLLSGAVNVSGPSTVLAAGASTTSGFGDGAISASGAPVIAGGNGAISSNNISSDGSGVTLRGLIGVTTPTSNTYAGDQVTFSGLISGGPVTIAKTAASNGFNTVVLTNSGNNWSGATSVDGALLVIGNNNVLPTTTNLTMVGAGSASRLHVPSGRTQQVGQLLGSGLLHVGGTLKFGDPSPNVTFAGGAVFSDGIGDPAAGGTVEKLGLSTANWGNTTSNTYTGTFKISEGWMRIGSATTRELGNNGSTNQLIFDIVNQGPNGPDGVAGGGLQVSNPMTMTRPIVIGPGGGWLDTSSNSNRLTWSGSILSGTGTIHKFSKLHLSLMNDNPNFSGAWELGFRSVWQNTYASLNNMGALNLGSGNAAGDGSATNMIIMQPGSQLNVVAAGTAFSAPQKLVINGTLVNPSDFRSANDNAATTSPTYAGQISGSGVLLFGQKSRITFHGAGTNTFSGPIYVRGDNVLFGIFSDNDLGDSSVTNVVNMAETPAGSGLGVGSNPATLQLKGNVVGNHRLNVGSGSGGAVVDTNGFNGTVGQVVAFSASGGSLSSSRFTKSGSGTLTVPSLSLSPSAFAVTGGTLKVAPGGLAAGVSVVNTTAIGSTGKFDITDNHLIDHSTGAGTWQTTNTYSGITGLVATGKGTSNLWNGTTGIITSQTQAIGSNFHSIGVAKGSDARPNTVSETALWAGQTIVANDTLVMYTYGGDATLDGKINVDDYIKIDNGIAAGLTGWSNGDFNYDGKVNIDDYTTVIDANIGNQNGFVFPTGGGITGVTAIPEPVLLAPVGATALLMRRRRNPLVPLLPARVTGL